MGYASTVSEVGAALLFVYSFIKQFKPDYAIHDAGTYETYSIVVEYDVVDHLTNTNIHYIDSYLFARIYDQTGAPSYTLWEKETVNIYGG